MARADRPHPGLLQPGAELTRVAGIPAPRVKICGITSCRDAGHAVSLGADAVRIHSPMGLQEALRLRRRRPGLRILKSVHILDESCLTSAALYADRVDAFVADSFNPATGQVGGTGITHDWGLTARLVRHVPRPVILAGGLTPMNVREAIQRVRPYGVDVNSGVKAADGSKDPGLIRAFIREACRSRV